MGATSPVFFMPFLKSLIYFYDTGRNIPYGVK